MESVTPCQVSINKNDVFLHGDPHSIKDKVSEDHFNWIYWNLDFIFLFNNVVIKSRFGLVCGIL